MRSLHEAGDSPQTTLSDLDVSRSPARRGSAAQRIAGARRRLDFVIVRLLLMRPTDKRGTELMAAALAAFDTAVDIARGGK